APPAMQVDNTNLTFTATEGGSNPPSQGITVTNTGGDGLHWKVSVQSAGWLTAAPRSGNDNSGASTQITFSVNMNGLNVGSYSATPRITHSTGSPDTVNVALTVNPQSTPTPLPTPNVTPAPTPTHTPTPQTAPTPSASPSP